MIEYRGCGWFVFFFQAADGIRDGQVTGVQTCALPILRGVLFDLPNVVAEAPAVLEQADVGDRCEIVGGSFLSDPLPPADAYVLSQILHDWDDEHSATILRNCRRTIADDGQLLVLDGVVPPGPEPGFLKHMDLHMLVMLGGKERTEDEWRDLLFGEGFDIAQISSAGPANLIEA